MPDQERTRAWHFFEHVEGTSTEIISTTPVVGGHHVRLQQRSVVEELNPVEPAVVELVLEEAEQEVVPVLAGVWEMDTITPLTPKSFRVWRSLLLSAP
jgi:hypothetical protein